MDKIAVLGAGFVTKPAIDFFLDTCGYQVTVTSLNKNEAESLINGRAHGVALAWSIDQAGELDRIVREADLVVSMIPPQFHTEVAHACLRHKKNMVTTSYISSEMEALDAQCRERGILILNEIGEDPGLDNMSTKRMIDQVMADNGKILSVSSYGAGLPAFENNTNPLGYKFSWSPKGLIAAAQSPAAYMENGTRVEVSAQELFTHHWLVDLDDIGTFETYPNRDAEKYMECFNLNQEVSLYRGLLRFTGWCNTMKQFGTLGLFDNTNETDLSDTTYTEFMAGLIKASSSKHLRGNLAHYLKVDINADCIKKIQWLGLLDDEPVKIKKGTNAEVLVDAMTRKLSYSSNEKDMVIIHTEILADFSFYREKRISSLLMLGEPGGDSAMSRSVSLPAAVAARRIVENKIKLKGVHRPTTEAVYRPVLEELEGYGYQFVTKTHRKYK